MQNYVSEFIENFIFFPKEIERSLLDFLTIEKHPTGEKRS